MKNQKILLASLVVLITIFACANFSDLIEATEAQSTPSPTSPDVEAQSIPTILPTETTQPTEEPSPYSQIQTILLTEPPCVGNKEVRKDAILALDEYLKDDAVIWDEDLLAFYRRHDGTCGLRDQRTCNFWRSDLVDV